jgi:peptide-methionine (S)-S-oxide reductase
VRAGRLPEVSKMTTRTRRLLVGLPLTAAIFLAHAAVVPFVPVPATAEADAKAGGDQVAVFAGGCFWGVEAVFEHVKGVRQAESGYAGGSAMTARYALVSSGRTGHAESVRVVYDPKQVSYGQLLTVFFTVAHDPTQLNRQGPDTGPQYRSAIFYGNPAQQAAAKAYIAQMERSRVFDRPVVTQVVPLVKFHPAEDDHQDFARLNPRHPYIVHHDAPKVRNLKAKLPGLYAGR